MSKPAIRSTVVGRVREDVLAYTASRDVELDRELLVYDCAGTAAHAIMLSEMKIRPPVLRRRDARAAVEVLAELAEEATRGRFQIRPEDQDGHLAIERRLTQRLGEIGRRIHTGRSRNDQVATALRLHTRDHLLAAALEIADLADALLTLGEAHRDVPMVGRTHLQPAMPSSVGLWAAAWAEDLLDDAAIALDAADLADQCPLGSAASYGVPLPIDRERTAELLGFSRATHTVLYANHTRGKIEALALHAAAQTMTTLSRLAEDLVLFSMPEFGYFELPEGFCTGSSIMPQKRNPDVLELVRARAARVAADAAVTLEILRAAPSGYQRDLQETKEPYLRGMATTRASLRILAPLVRGLKVCADRLRASFDPSVFATDRALELVASGMPFRDAYGAIRQRLGELRAEDPGAAIARKTHLGAPAGIRWDELRRRASAVREEAAGERAHLHRALSRLFRRPFAGGDDPT
ncbi:MAG: argininosuccinate lyase [Kiritimatiellae bacterium]|nr:argininosuccinate lyase [Kiritimatiellia bacterium]